MNDTGDLVLGVRRWRVVQHPQRRLGQDIARGHAFGGGLCANTRQAVARLFFIRLAHEEAHVGEFIGLAK